MPDDLVTLAVPPGAEEYPISEGTEQFVPYREDHTDPASRWLVDLPRETAGRFLHNGGFTMAKRAAPAPGSDLARLRHPDGYGCSWGGAGYEPDESGIVAVPPEAVAALLAHGFAPGAAVEDAPAEAAAVEDAAPAEAAEGA